jgi:hypothetical protein
VICFLFAAKLFQCFNHLCGKAPISIDQELCKRILEEQTCCNKLNRYGLQAFLDEVEQHHMKGGEKCMKSDGRNSCTCVCKKLE